MSTNIVPSTPPSMQPMMLLPFHPSREQIRETRRSHRHPPAAVLLRNRHQHDLFLPSCSSKSIVSTDDDRALRSTFHSTSSDGAELDGELNGAFSSSVDHRSFEETWTGEPDGEEDPEEGGDGVLCEAGEEREIGFWFGGGGGGGLVGLGFGGRRMRWGKEREVGGDEGGSGEKVEEEG